MNATTFERTPSFRTPPPSARIVLGLLQRIGVGTLDVQTPDGRKLTQVAHDWFDVIKSDPARKEHGWSMKASDV